MSEGSSTTARPIDVELYLAGGHRHQLTLPEDSPLLVDLFSALSTGGAQGGFVQLPMREGRAACSFHVSQLVSVVTQPPVLVEAARPAVEEARPAPRPASQAQQPMPIEISQPGFTVVDDFLGPEEHADMLAYALANQEQFEPGTVAAQRTDHRENLVSMRFGQSAHATLLCNRLLTWLPVLCRSLDQPLFPLETVECQLTAGNDGHYYRIHNDSGHGETNPRALSCVYYFFRDPKAFEGGELRLYDAERQGDAVRPSKTFRVIQPVANRLVIFRSDAFHEVRPVKCPSGDFADSRFAVTTWLRRRDEDAAPNPDARFGWGQLRCGVVPPNFA